MTLTAGYRIHEIPQNSLTTSVPAFTQNFTADRSRFHEALYDDQIWGELSLYQLGK